MAHTVNSVQLTVTTTAGFSPLMVTFQIISNNAPGTFQQALYDFNGDGIVDFTTNTLGTVTVTYTNGQYFPLVTLQTTTGRFSSSGGWNSSDPNRVQITVQSSPTTTTFASITDPVIMAGWRTMTAGPVTVTVPCRQTGCGDAGCRHGR